MLKRLCIACLSALIVGCANPDAAGRTQPHTREVGDTVRRTGLPNMTYVSPDDQLMNAAIAQARASLPGFEAVLRNPLPEQHDFQVKAEFAHDNGTEFIWLSDPHFNGKEVTGFVNNVPVDATYLELGQNVAVSRASIADWMYVEGGLLKGGFTVRVQFRHFTPEERREQEHIMGARLE